MPLPMQPGNARRLLAKVRANIANAHHDIGVPSCTLPHSHARNAVLAVERHLVTALDELDRAVTELPEGEVWPDET